MTDQSKDGGSSSKLEKLNSFQLKGVRRVNDEEQKSDLELQREEESLPIQVRERRQTV